MNWMIWIRRNVSFQIHHNLFQCTSRVTHSRGVLRKIVIDLKRNIPYALHHPSNIMDSYEGTSIPESCCAFDPRTKFLFVHGGMWILGSKDHQALSMYEFLQGLASLSWKYSFSSDTSDTFKNPIFRRAAFSNLGATIARHGGRAYLINYRLVDCSKQDSSSHQQVMDVARAISFLIQQEWEERQRSNVVGHRHIPNIWISGFSAGAHLTALVLAKPAYIYDAMKEIGLHDYSIQLEHYLAGYVGFSGPYNLRRMMQSPWGDLTLGPAFGGKAQFKNDSTRKEIPIQETIIAEASPIHLLLSVSPMQQGKNCIPILATMPTLLINAENDFHLSQDSKELLVALERFPSKPLVPRLHCTIPSTNHFTLMKDFGSSYDKDYQVVDSDTSQDLIQRHHHPVEESNPIFSNTLGYLQSILYNKPTPVSDASKHVMEFMSRVMLAHDQTM